MSAVLTCPDCQASTAREWHVFSRDCPGCAARAVARGPNYRESLTAGRQTLKYRAEMELLKVSHDDVKRAADVDLLGRVPA